MYGHDTKAYQNRVSSFGWKTLIINGHSFPEILQAYQQAISKKNQPTMIIAKTIKGKGVRLMEDKNGWHGRVLSKEQFKNTQKNLGKINLKLRGKIKRPKKISPQTKKPEPKKNLKLLPDYKIGKQAATRKAYGTGLVKAASKNPNIVALDGEVKNSTFSQTFEEYYKDRFFEMFIAEQNMVSAALGLSLSGKIPFVSTFAAFLTRAHDQIRMAQYSKVDIKFVGSHVGVSVGEDGPSQMGLEDIAMMRTIRNCVVLYPSDAVSCEKLVLKATKHQGIVYIRTTRKNTPVIYTQNESFSIGGSKVVKQSNQDDLTIIAAGVTLHEALKAHEQLLKENIKTRIIDLYSIKPIDKKTLKKAAKETKAIIVVEDHHPEGGIAEAVRTALASEKIKIHSLSVSKDVMSGTSDELLNYQGIAADAIVAKAKGLL
jgi:transketolase